MFTAQATVCIKRKQLAHRSRGVKVKVQAQKREAFATTPSSLRLPLMMYHKAEEQKIPCPRRSASQLTPVRLPVALPMSEPETYPLIASMLFPRKWVVLCYEAELLLDIICFLDAQP